MNILNEISISLLLGDDVHQALSKVFRSESTSLPFGIANVLQTNRGQTKIPTQQDKTTTNSISPWILNFNQLAQSTSFTALANASNWCARCSMHFRLTSDLVHHIRVHHATRRSHASQSSNSEASTRKSFVSSVSSSSSIGTSLQCHICGETFRQRHHLTRHMTSHR